MLITFYSAKDAANLAKHGVSLALAAQLEWDSAAVWAISLRKANPREVNRYAKT